MKTQTRSALLLRSVLSACFLSLGLIHPSFADLDPLGTSLRGLGGVYASVGETTSPVTDEIMDRVKFDERVEEAATKELSKNGVLSQNDPTAELDLHIAEVRNPGEIEIQGQSSGFIVTLEVRQNVHLLRDPSVITSAATYTRAAFVSGGINKLGDVENQTVYLIEEFLQSYFGANGHPMQRVILPPSEAARINQEVAGVITHTLNERFAHPRLPEAGYAPFPPEPDVASRLMPLAIVATVNVDGVATLKGTLSSPDLKEMATHIANEWPGVTRVQNLIRLSVKPGNSSKDVP